MAITLNTKAYTFSGLLNGIAQYLHRGAGVAASFLSLTGRVRLTAKDSHISWQLRVPVVATEASACACPGEAMRVSHVDISVKVPAGATAAERDDLAKQVKDLTASTEFQSSIASLQQPSS